MNNDGLGVIVHLVIRPEIRSLSWQCSVIDRPERELSNILPLQYACRATLHHLPNSPLADREVSQVSAGFDTIQSIAS